MSGENEKSLKHKAISGGKWSLLRRFSGQAVTFVVTLVLARLLTPRDFGLMAMLTVFVELGITLSEAGMTRALIRTVDISDEDYSTAFYFNLAAAIAIYAIIWVCSPLIACFFNAPPLELLARIIAFNIPLRALCSLKLSTLEAELDFRRPAIAEFSANVISGGIGIGAALQGAGVMAIVTYQVSNALLLAVILFSITRRRRLGRFSTRSFKRLFGFGSRLLASGVLHVVYNNMYLFLIGKFYRPASLGYFTRGRQFASVPPVAIGESLKGVAYSTLCRFKDDPEQLAAKGLRILRLCACVTFPVMIFICFSSNFLIGVLIGRQWGDSADIMSLMCVGMAFYPIDVINLQIIQAAGRSDHYLHAEIWKKGIGVAALLIALPYGIKWIALAFSLATIAGVLIDMVYCQKSSGLGVWRQIKAVFPTEMTALLGGVAGAMATIYISNDMAILLARFAVTFAVYWLLAEVFKIKGFRELKSIVMSR